MGLDAGDPGKGGFRILMLWALAFQAPQPPTPAHYIIFSYCLFSTQIICFIAHSYLTIQEYVKNKINKKADQVPTQQELSLKMHLYTIQIDTSREKFCQIQTIIICIFYKLEKQRVIIMQHGNGLIQWIPSRVRVLFLKTQNLARFIT